MIETEQFLELLGYGKIEIFALILIRFGAVVFLLPGIASNYLPTYYKLGFAFVISSIIFPIISYNQLESQISENFSLGSILQEACLGVAIGITLRTAIFALQICGTIIAQSSSIAQIFGGSVSNDAQSTVSNILVISGIALLMITGYLDQVAVFMSSSYQQHPIHSDPSSIDILNTIVDTATAGYSLAFQLATPFLALSLFYNITLGAINRAMPQLLVSFVGAPGIIAASIGLLVITTKPLLDTWLSASDRLFISFWVN